MSPYGYDYSLAPSASTGWRSRFVTVMTVGAIVAISAISGAAVALNLLAPAGTTSDRPVTIATHAPASAPVAQAVPSARPQPAIATATVPQLVAPAAAVRPASQPAAAPAPQAAPPQAAPVVAAVEAPPAAQVPERELTFTQGYARRRAVQAAAEGPKTEMARVETQGQFGRAATRTKPRVARATAPQDPRRVAEEGGPFSRFEQPEKFDFARHQALAFGESRDPRANRRPPSQGGGLFGNSPSGFFGGLF